MTDDWIEELIKPFTPNPVGEDPRYHDDFIFIKSEIEKLSGANFKEVILKAKKLLLTTSKDLRIAVYLVLALTAEEGITGFIAGLKNCALLLHHFKDHLRLDVLEWLNQPRLMNLLPKEISTEHYDAIKHININLTWLNQKKPVEHVMIIAPKSEESIDELTQKIIDSLRAEKLETQAAYYARALRWGDISLPEDKIIPPPREENVIQLNRCLEKDEPEKIYELCENLFLEPGGVFWLDLQYYSHSLIATQHTRHLIEKFPELIELHFNNGMPFANDETRQWLLSLIENKKEEKTKPIKKIRAKDLNSHLKQLKNQSINTVREKFEQHYAMAKACMLHKRYDVALALFQLLDERIFKHQLQEWEPELVLSIWEDYYDVLAIEIKKQEDANKINQKKLLQTRICQLDVLRGMRL